MCRRYTPYRAIRRLAAGKAAERYDLRALSRKDHTSAQDLGPGIATSAVHLGDASHFYEGEDRQKETESLFISHSSSFCNNDLQFLAVN
jgi:hypothetical protein